MSPLWSDLALARAALADAVERGLVEETPRETRRSLPLLKRVRRIPRRRAASFAL
ncbi:hypothetical protein [Sphingomonas sp. URHD0057]|uniref:hypothetical protein n=1 Tax=Sphingomonas sp. URHD0057 TaxID=1380389 RepID=UPI000A505CFA|nr:hypothetical protein [Sphingomonas sp. URHD0057]